MSSEDGHHLRDEAGSLLAAFEEGGAEELTVTSGGTAIAALGCGQSHMSSEAIFSSRACASYNCCHAQEGQAGLARAFIAVEFTRAACDSLRNSTRAEPRKRRCAPPINAHLPPPTYPDTYIIIPHYTLRYH